MATTNPFDLLGEDDSDDVSKLVAIQKQKVVAMEAPAPAPVQGKAAKLPSKPLPPAQAVRESKTEGPRGGGRGGGRGYGRGRGGGGYDRDLANNDNSFSSRGFSGGQGGAQESDGGRQSERQGGYGGGPRPYRGGGSGGGRRGGFSNGEGEEGERPRRTYERRSGTGRGNEFKREGAGRGNWGTQTDEVAQITEDVVVEGEKPVTDKPLAEEEAADVNKESPTAEAEEKEKEAEDKEMTLEEYQKVLEEKRKALEALKTEERKVVIDKELASMQPLSNKKSNDEVFAKLGSDKEKRKETVEKEERAKKSLSINEFLKPAEGERYYGGRGRGSRGGRGGPRGGGGGGGGFTHRSYAEATPSIEDPGQFPTLGGK